MHFVRDTKPKNEKFAKFWDISGTAEDTNLKFCTWIEGKGPATKQTRCSAIAERPRCRVRYSFRQK